MGAAVHLSEQPALERTAALLRRLGEAETPEEHTRLHHEVVVANMPLADAIAQRYRARGIALQDLQQVAYLALTTAVQRFDPERAADAVGPQFIAFAAVTIRGEVRRHFRDHGWVIRPPRRIQELQPRVSAANEELWRTLGRSARPSEIAAHLDEPLEHVVEAASAVGLYAPASLDGPVSGGSDGVATLADTVGEEDADLARSEATLMLAPLVRRLGDRDRRIIELRFYQGLTQREIADDLGITQMQVSRLLARIYRSLRSELDGRTDAGTNV